MCVKVCAYVCVSHVVMMLSVRVNVPQQFPFTPINGNNKLIVTILIVATIPRQQKRRGPRTLCASCDDFRHSNFIWRVRQIHVTHISEAHEAIRHR